MELVTTHDAEKRLAGFKCFADVMLCEIVRYGIYNRQDMIAPRSELYQKLLIPQPDDAKFEILSAHHGTPQQHVLLIHQRALALHYRRELARYRLAGTPKQIRKVRSVRKLHLPLRRTLREPYIVGIARRPPRY
jgi:hypothetical protein